MAINKLPCLSPAYPLFDWKTWPDSEAALVQGGSTRKFQISCWNAIVIELENAIIASGGTWNTLYTTASEAKMDKDGRLFADKFNSLTKNIDEIVPLGWQWAVNPNFRGYIERQYFRGASDDPKNPDKLYPEYIKELVRRMNLVIEIMKDEYPGMFNAVSDYVSTTAVASGCVSAQEALPVCSNWISSKCVDLAAAAKLPAPVTVDAISLFNFEAVEPTSKESLPFTVETISSIKHSRPDVIAVPKRNVRHIGADGYSISGVDWDGSKSARPSTPIKLRGHSISGIDWGGVSSPSRGIYLIYKAHSNVIGTKISAQEALSVEPDGRSFTNIIETDISARQACGVDTTALLTTASYCELDPLLYLDTKSEYLGMTKRKINAVSGRRGISDLKPYGVKAQTAAQVQNGRFSDAAAQIACAGRYGADARSMTAKATDFQQIIPVLQKANVVSDQTVEFSSSLGVKLTKVAGGRNVKSGAMDVLASAKQVETFAAAEIATGWLPPIWVDDGLHIRQVHDDPVLNDNGELVIT